MKSCLLVLSICFIGLTFGAPQRLVNSNSNKESSSSTKPGSQQQKQQHQQQPQQQQPQIQQGFKPIRSQQAPQQQPPQHEYGYENQPSGQQVPQMAPSPQINWGQCPQLEPTMDEKIKKAGVITRCLEITPIPNNITRETVELHREQVAACALQVEGWFNEQGLYRFDKAESEIKSKKLSKETEEKVLMYHKQCKEEAEDKFPASSKNLIAQIQLYQACMDYFISEVCGIEVGVPQDFGSPAQFQ